MKKRLTVLVAVFMVLALTLAACQPAAPAATEAASSSRKICSHDEPYD